MFSRNTFSFIAAESQGYTFSLCSKVDEIKHEGSYCKKAGLVMNRGSVWIVCVHNRLPLESTVALGKNYMASRYVKQLTRYQENCDHHHFPGLSVGHPWN